MKRHLYNQVLIEYPQRLDRLAMGENRSKVLREISAAADLKSMEATEQEDVVAVSARFFHDDQGEAFDNVFGALGEIADLCHGARAKKHHATEARRRAIEAEAKAGATSADADSLERPTGEQEAMDAAQNSTTTRKTCDKGDSQDTNHTSSSGRGEE